jgi:uncharacterized membrane protein
MDIVTRRFRMSSLAPYLHALGITAAVGAGLVAGVLLAFSTAVMKALSRLPSEQGIQAMQHVNVIIINPVFLGLFMGTALLSAMLGLAAVFSWDTPGSPWLLMGALAYLIGTFGVTMAINVPLNNRLAVADPSSAQAAGLWSFYLARWVRWNHFRTLWGTVAAAAFAIGASRLA